MIDLYTHSFAYLGTRTFGSDGDNFLVVGPVWEGEQPEDMRAVIRYETELFYVLFRTQLFNASNLSKVHTIQAGIKTQPLSQLLGKFGKDGSLTFRKIHREPIWNPIGCLHRMGSSTPSGESTCPNQKY